MDPPAVIAQHGLVTDHRSAIALVPDHQPSIGVLVCQGVESGACLHSRAPRGRPRAASPPRQRVTRSCAKGISDAQSSTACALREQDGAQGAQQRALCCKLRTPGYLHSRRPASHSAPARHARCPCACRARCAPQASNRGGGGGGWRAASRERAALPARSVGSTSSALMPWQLCAHCRVCFSGRRATAIRPNAKLVWIHAE